MRISDLLKIVHESSYLALSQVLPSKQHAMNYFSSCLVVYQSSSSAFETDTNKEINKKIRELIRKGLQLCAELKYTQASQKQVEVLMSQAAQFEYCLHTGLQNLGYFFRFGQSEPRGIKAGIEIFSQEVWSGKKSEPKEEKDGV